MKSPLFKDNVEDREIRFKAPEEIDVIHNKVKSRNPGLNAAGDKEVR